MLVAIFVSPCSAQAPGDEDEHCTIDYASPPVYSDTERNLMDSYNYLNLLPGNGTEAPPISNAIWSDMSYDGNDATPETIIPNLCKMLTHNNYTLLTTYIYSGNKEMEGVSISVTCLWMEKARGHTE